MTKKVDTTNSYDADQIQVLEGLEPVRVRPGMYIGSTGSEGLHHLVTEIVNNSMDEAIGGFADHIKVEFFEDGSVAVYDNGRGIPYGIKKGYGVSALELAFTKLHAGGKFGGGSYKVSSGLHGVGASVANALSKWMRVVVKRGDEVVIQEYENGGKVVRPVEKLDPKKPVTKLKNALWNIDLGFFEDKDESHNSGTIVQFFPDNTIFETIEFNFKQVTSQLKEYAYLTAGIKFEIVDHPNDQEKVFYFEGGIKTFIKSLNRNKTPLNPTIFYAQKENDGVMVEAALQYNDTFTENVMAFANHLKNTEGGTHATGFRAALTKSVNDYARAHNILKEKDPNLSGDDLKEGLTAIISIKLDSAILQFEGQTKGKLGNSNVRAAVETVVKEALDRFFEENPRDAQAIVEKNILSFKARMAAKAARDTVIRKTVLDGGGVLPGKLADCSQKNNETTELFIVEGDSAGGCFFGATAISLADGRNLSFEEIVKEQNEGKEHFCYTIKEHGQIGIEKFINARITRKNAQVIKVTLDNNEEIICTPDHPFMMRDGRYKKVSEIGFDESLMPLNRKLSDKKDKGITIAGYEMVWSPKSEKWIFTHILADQYNVSTGIANSEQGATRHHMDFHKLNNDPTNIVRMTKEDHFQLHRETLPKTLHRPDVKIKSAEAKRTEAFRTKARNKSLEKSELFSANAKEQWKNPEYKEQMKNNWLNFYKSNEGYRRENNQRLVETGKSYWKDSSNKKEQAERVKVFFEEHPERKDWLSSIASEQWQDQSLLVWRSGKTKEQWTDEFRSKRKEALKQTYYNKTIKTLKHFMEASAEFVLDQYNDHRILFADKSLLKFDTFCKNYFAGDTERAWETVKNYNHKIIKTEKVTERYDVYDAEVPGTHNFALASGVFVHNSAKQGRNREFQAILPLFGKPLNSERARLDKIIDNDRLKSLVIALGAGIGEQYTPEKLRYNKLIIMADADVDGAHINALYLTFFYRHMKELIENGHIYVAAPPLYKATMGKEKQYLFDDKEREAFLKTEQGKKAIVQRFKGLGEMNAEELWETTMNPSTRRLKKINIEDAAQADEVFTMLMGDEVAPRKRFIQTHSKLANIDVT